MTSLDKNNNEAGTYDPNLAKDDFDLFADRIFKVYPNPFYDAFTIEFNKSISNIVQVSIFEGTGKQVWQQNVDNNADSKLIVSPSNLNTGIYYVRVNFENGISESFKVIKK